MKKGDIYSNGVKIGEIHDDPEGSGSLLWVRPVVTAGLYILFLWLTMKVGFLRQYYMNDCNISQPIASAKADDFFIVNGLNGLKALWGNGGWLEVILTVLGVIVPIILCAFIGFKVFFNVFSILAGIAAGAAGLAAGALAVSLISCVITFSFKLLFQFFCIYLINLIVVGIVPLILLIGVLAITCRF